MSESGLDIAELRRWIGRTEIVEEVIAAMPVRMRAAMLDHDDTPPRAGDPIPPRRHATYLNPSHRQSSLADDGHRLRGQSLPPGPPPRPPCAGRRLRFLNASRLYGS